MVLLHRNVWRSVEINNTKFFSVVMEVVCKIVHKIHVIVIQSNI